MNNLSFDFKNGCWAYRLGIFAIISSVVFVSSPAAWIPLAGNLDEWYYIGYGKFYFQNPDFHAYYYKISRLPWILIQTFFRNVFSNQVASISIVFAYLLVTGFLVFAILQRFLGKGMAFLLAIFFSLLPTNQGLGGWNYHNTAAGPFFLFSLWFILKAMESQRWSSVFFLLSGSALALCIHSNIVFVNLLPVIPFFSIAVYYWNHQSDAFQHSLGKWALKISMKLAIFLMGGLIATAILSCVNMASGRPFDFWTQQFLLASRFVADNTNQLQWWKPLSSEWVLQSPWLIFPVAVLFANLAWIALSSLQGQTGFCLRFVDSNLAKVLFSLQVIFTTLLWFVWQILGQTALDWSYFTYPLLFSSLLGLLPFFKWKPAEPHSDSLPWIWIVIGFCMVLPILLAEWSRHIQFPVYTWMWVSATILAIVLLLFCSFYRQRDFYGPAGMAILFIVLTIASNRLSDFSRILGSNEIKIDLSNAVFSMAEEVGDKVMSRGGKAAVWFDEDEKLQVNQSSIGKIIPDQSQLLKTPADSFRGLGISGLPRKPKTPISSIDLSDFWLNEHLVNGRPIIMLTKTYLNVEEMLGHINQAGFNYSVKNSEIIKTRFFEIPLYILTGSAQINSIEKNLGS